MRKKTTPEPQAEPQAGPPVLTLTLNAETTALILDGLAMLPLHRSHGLFTELRAAYEKTFTPPKET